MKFRSSFFFLDGTIIIIVLETFNNENKMYEINKSTACSLKHQRYLTGQAVVRIIPIGTLFIN